MSYILEGIDSTVTWIKDCSEVSGSFWVNIWSPRNAFVLKATTGVVAKIKAFQKVAEIFPKLWISMHIWLFFYLLSIFPFLMDGGRRLKKTEWIYEIVKYQTSLITYKKYELDIGLFFQKFYVFVLNIQAVPIIHYLFGCWTDL